MVRIVIDPGKIESFCRRHHIQQLALFGSVLREDFLPISDVDVLVEFKPGHLPGLAFFAMQEELSSILGREVDLNGSLSSRVGKVVSYVIPDKHPLHVTERDELVE